MFETQQVVVRVPATTRHVAVVRAAASSVAALLDASYDQLTDLHIALDEACSRILACSDPRPTRFEVRLAVGGDGVEVRAAGDTPLRGGAEVLTSWSRAILETITRDLRVGTDAGSPSISFLVPVG